MKREEQEEIDLEDIEDTQPMKFLSAAVNRACDAWLAKRGMKPENWNQASAREKQRAIDKAKAQNCLPSAYRICDECLSRFEVKMTLQRFCCSSCKLRSYRKAHRKAATP